MFDCLPQRVRVRLCLAEIVAKKKKDGLPVSQPPQLPHFPTRCTVPASAATRCDVQWRLLLVWLDCLSVFLPKIAYLKAD